MKMSYCRVRRSRSAIVGHLLSPPRENLNEDVIQSQSNMERAPDLLDHTDIFCQSCSRFEDNTY